MARPSSKQVRAREAREISDNGTLRVIFDERAADIRSKWESSRTIDERETCHADIRALNELKDAIYAAATARAE
jgi:hypothetical protein